jgi:hypothetical protein
MAIRTQVAFAITPEWVLYHPTLSDRAIRLYGVMMRHADNDTHRCHPSRRRLAECMHCSVDTVDRATAELINAGAVVSSPRQREDGSQSSNDYTMIILPPTLGTSAEAGGGKTEAPSSRKDSAPRTRTNKNIEPVERDDETSSRTIDHPLVAPMTGRDEPLVTITTYGVEAEPSSPRSAPPSSPTYEDWEALALHLGWNPKLNVGLNLKTLKSLHAAGVTAEQIIGCVEWMRADPWWGPKGVDLKKTAGRMQEYLSRQDKPQRPSMMDQYDEMMNDPSLDRYFGGKD